MGSRWDGAAVQWVRPVRLRPTRGQSQPASPDFTLTSSIGPSLRNIAFARPQACRCRYRPLPPSGPVQFALLVCALCRACAKQLSPASPSVIRLI